MPNVIRLCLTLVLLSLIVPCAATTSEPPLFDRSFIDATLRIDVFHVGDADEEFFTLDRVYRQGVWAGSRTTLIDPFGYGAYRVMVYDKAEKTLLYSRGFSSYFGEYRATGPEKGRHRGHCRGSAQRRT